MFTTRTAAARQSRNDCVNSELQGQLWIQRQADWIVLTRILIERNNNSASECAICLRGRVMVKRKFENLEIDFWVHPGKLGVTQPSLCLSRDAAQSSAPLLDALTELEGEPCPAHRTLTFRPCLRKQALRKLTLMLVSERTDLKVMNIRSAADTGTIEMTIDGLPLVISAIVSWQAGAEDFGVSPRRSSCKPKQFGKLDKESGELWFWGPYYFYCPNLSTLFYSQWRQAVTRLVVIEPCLLVSNQATGRMPRDFRGRVAREGNA